MTAESMFRQCLKKRKYSWERAEQVKARRFREAGVRLRTYFCPLCSHYHLTHLPYDGNVRNARDITNVAKPRILSTTTDGLLQG